MMKTEGVNGCKLIKLAFPLHSIIWSRIIKMATTRRGITLSDTLWHWIVSSWTMHHAMDQAITTDTDNNVT